LIKSSLLWESSLQNQWEHILFFIQSTTIQKLTFNMMEIH
jgi:hypothetical protein